MSIVKEFAKKLRYVKMYITCFHIFAEAGTHSVMYKPLRVTGGKRIKIGDYCYILPGLRIEAYECFKDQRFNPEIIIGNRVNIGQNCQISSSCKVVIEDDVTFGPNVMINDTTHGYRDTTVPIEEQPLSGKPITIKSGSLLGWGVVVLPGVTIGKNCMIGAYSVIAKDVPDNTVVVNHSNLVYKTIEEKDEH